MRNFSIAMLASFVCVVIIDKLFGGYIAEGIREDFEDKVEKTYDSFTNALQKIMHLTKHSLTRVIHPSHVNIGDEE